jgi:RsiW-degrading membrane proteinase PrsW (M82 family)
VRLAAYLILGFAPGIFWLWWFRRKDDLEPEPHGRLLKVFLLGAASTALVLAVHPLLAPWLRGREGAGRTLLEVFVLVALVEECAKLLAFLLGAYLSRDLDEPLDGIVYGIAAALGFASTENVVYMFRFEDPGLIVMRSFTATLAHVVFTGSMGFFFGLARFRRRKLLLMAAGLALAVLLHGLYDLFLLPGRAGPGLVSLLGLLPLGLLSLGLKIRWARARSAEHHPELVEGTGAVSAPRPGAGSSSSPSRGRRRAGRRRRRSR